MTSGFEKSQISSGIDKSMPANTPTHRGAKNTWYTNCIKMPPTSMTNAPTRSIVATTHIGLKFVVPTLIFTELPIFGH